MIISGIYKITFKGTYESYIGESLDIDYRWKDHIEKLNNVSHENYKLQSLWSRYGADYFEFEIVATIDTSIFTNKLYQKCILLLFENLYIQKHDSINNGLNIENTFN